MKSLFDKKIAVVLLLILSALLAFSPAGTRTATKLSPMEIATIVTSKSDHVEAEQVADLLINREPDLLLVDIRTGQEYNQYHIPGAINIPMTQLFEESSLELLDPEQTIVLYSNGGTHAAQAWVMLQQYGIQSYVLLGGLNYWSEAILNPKPPEGIVADSEILRYKFRKAASGHFNKGESSVQEEVESTTPTVKPKLMFKKKKKAEEGC